MKEKAESAVRQSPTIEPTKEEPAGGYDPTPVPSAPPGHTVRITFHRAKNLPFADIHTLSSDPYLTATLKLGLPKRHKQDPDLVFRTPTIRRNTNPEWNSVWDVAHIPSSGFHLKIRLYDEDRADRDDRLGNVHVHVTNIDHGWGGLGERSYHIQKRTGSKRAYLVRGCAAILWKEVKMYGELVLSVECLGQSEGDGGRAYTIGPSFWTRHYSPLIGRLTGTKDRYQSQGKDQRPERYNFQAIQIQLAGPVPSGLYHRYVEFKPFVAGMFDARSPRGWVLNRALHHQHCRIYNFDSSTLYGFFRRPCLDMTKQFLDFVHYDHCGRIFTYVLTLDAQWRFTETGPEFGIDLLSKHTMHSDLSVYIAFSGEFFIRRLRQSERRKPGMRDAAESSADINTDDDHHHHNSDAGSNMLLPERASDAGSSRSAADSNIISGDPSDYEMIIDNDSGTYRPNAECLQALRRYMCSCLPGLRIVTLDCQADSEQMNRLKAEQRRRKRESKGQVQYLQRTDTSSSISSSDEEELDEMIKKGNGEDRGGKLRQTRTKLAMMKPRIDMAREGVRSGAGVGGHLEASSRQRYSEHRSKAMGGIVGEEGPVRMREKAQKVERARKRHSRQKSGDHRASEPPRERNESPGDDANDGTVSEKPDGTPSDVVEAKDVPNEERR